MNNVDNGESAVEKSAIECARNIYQEARDWYKVAETKAQILFALDGAAITAITTSIFSKPSEARSVIAALPWYSMATLGLSCVAFIASVLCAVVCIWSRLYTEDDLDKKVGRSGSTVLLPDNLWFFQFYTRHNPEAVLCKLKEDRLAEARFMLANLPALGSNVTRKHRWVNRGFLLAGIAVILLLVAAALSMAILPSITDKNNNVSKAFVTEIDDDVLEVLKENSAALQKLDEIVRKVEMILSPQAAPPSQ
jgi:hypothetical protein